MPNQKAILCYGDSNTWGYVPLLGTRLDRDLRWTSLLQQKLGARFDVIAEGLNGRSTAWDEPFRPGRNALESIIPALHSHQPLDLVIIMLGTNDLKSHLNVNPFESGRGMAALIQATLSSGAGPAGTSPQVLVVSPPKFGRLSEAMRQHFGEDISRSAALSDVYRKVCDDFKCHFFDLNEVVSVGEDGIHLNETGHLKFADAFTPVVKSLVAD